MNNKTFIQKKKKPIFSLFSAASVFLICALLSATAAQAQTPGDTLNRQAKVAAGRPGCGPNCSISGPGDMPVWSLCVGKTMTIRDDECATSHNYSIDNPAFVSVDVSTGVVTGLAVGTAVVTYSGVLCTEAAFSINYTIEVNNAANCVNTKSCTVDCGKEYTTVAPTITNPDVAYTGVWQIDSGSGWTDFALPHTFLAADDGALVRYVLVKAASNDSIFSPNILELTVNCP